MVRASPDNADKVKNFAVTGQAGTKAAKQSMLQSSSNLITAGGTHPVADQGNVRVIDLQLSGLPTNTDNITVKKMSGARHVIQVKLDEDRMKGTCKGTGRMQIRLNQNQNLEDIKANFAIKGINVNEFEADVGRKPNMTAPPKKFGQEITNTRKQKQAMLKSSNAFGQ